MHSDSTRFTIILFVALIVVGLSIGVSSGKGNQPIAQETCRDLLKSLTAQDDPEVGSLLTQWADHLKSVTTYSIDDYMEALSVLQNEYASLTAQLEQCMANQNGTGKSYDPAWMDRFVERFGTQYLKKNEKTVLSNLQMVVAGDTENCCGPIMESLIYKEAVLYGAYRFYFNLFSDFYKERPPAAKKTLQSRKEAAENLLSLMDKRSFMRMLIGDDLPRKHLSEIAAKRANEPIYNYFKENPIGCDIDAFKVLADFRTAIGKNE